VTIPGSTFHYESDPIEERADVWQFYARAPRVILDRPERKRYRVDAKQIPVECDENRLRPIQYCRGRSWHQRNEGPESDA
jgi:hypothetical protein